MGNFIDILKSAAPGIIGAGMGIATAGLNDRRQIEMQKKLQEMQLQGNRQMIDYNMEKQLQMWKDTNYSAQMEELKKAGLNPGLLYGMSGGGGTTTGSGGGSVQGGNAPTGGGEIMGGMGMGIQLGMMQAQKALIEAQTEKTKAETTKTSTVDTQESQTRTQSLLQGINNAKAQEKILEVEKRLKDIQEFETKYSQNDRMDSIYYNVKQAMIALEMAERESFIQKATVNDKIDIIKSEAIGAGLRNSLTQANINATEEQIKKWTAEIAQNWWNLDRQERELKLKQWETELKAAYPSISEVIGNSVNNIIERLKRIIGDDSEFRPHEQKRSTK